MEKGILICVIGFGFPSCVAVAVDELTMACVFSGIGLFYVGMFSYDFFIEKIFGTKPAIPKPDYPKLSIKPNRPKPFIHKPYDPEQYAKDLQEIYASIQASSPSNTSTQYKEKSSYHKYLETDGWQERRQNALEAAGWRCQVCNNSERLEVHHRTYKNLGNETLDDVIVLCRGCHSKFHGKEY